MAGGLLSAVFDGKVGGVAAAGMLARYGVCAMEGAKFDGTDAAQALKVVVEQLLAGRLTHDELTAKRLTQALKTWQLAAPDETALCH